MSKAKPYEEEEYIWKCVTAGEMIEMLKTVPEDYEVRYDGACGMVIRQDFTIYHDEKKISING